MHAVSYWLIYVVVVPTYGWVEFMFLHLGYGVANWVVLYAMCAMYCYYVKTNN